MNFMGRDQYYQTLIICMLILMGGSKMRRGQDKRVNFEYYQSKTKIDSIYNAKVDSLKNAYEIELKNLESKFK